MHGWIIGDVRNRLLDVLLNEGLVSWVVELGLRSDVIGKVELPQLDDFWAEARVSKHVDEEQVGEVTYRVEVWNKCLIGSIQFCKAPSA